MKFLSLDKPDCRTMPTYPPSHIPCRLLHVSHIPHLPYARIPYSPTCPLPEPSHTPNPPKPALNQPTYHLPRTNTVPNSRLPLPSLNLPSHTLIYPPPSLNLPTPHSHLYPPTSYTRPPTIPTHMPLPEPTHRRPYQCLPPCPCFLTVCVCPGDMLLVLDIVAGAGDRCD
jgi:hypothetical protein